MTETQYTRGNTVAVQFEQRIEVISHDTAHDTRYVASSTTASQVLDKLNATLTDEQRELLETYDDAVAESETVMMEHAYRYGVTDGIGMMGGWTE